MTEEQLRAFPAFRHLPIVNESAPESLDITRNYVRECSTVDEIAACLGNAQLVPIGGLRAFPDGQVVVVAYFGAKD